MILFSPENIFVIIGICWSAWMTRRNKSLIKKTGTVYIRWPFFSVYLSSVGVPASAAGFFFVVWSLRLIAVYPGEPSGYGGLIVFAGMARVLFSRSFILGAEGILMGEHFIRWDRLKKAELIKRGRKTFLVLIWKTESGHRLSRRRVPVPSRLIFAVCRIISDVKKTCSGSAGTDSFF